MENRTFSRKLAIPLPVRPKQDDRRPWAVLLRLNGKNELLGTMALYLPDTPPNGALEFFRAWPNDVMVVRLPGQRRPLWYRFNGIMLEHIDGYAAACAIWGRRPGRVQRYSAGKDRLAQGAPLIDVEHTSEHVFINFICDRCRGACREPHNSQQLCKVCRGTGRRKLWESGK